MFNKLRKAIAKALNPEDSSWRSITGGVNGTSLANNTSTSNLMANHKNWVYVCVDKLSDTISGVNFRVRKYNKTGDDEIIIDHQASLLLDKPNNFRTGGDFLYLVVAHLELTGNAYLMKDQPTNPTKLLPTPPQNISLVMDKEGFEPIGYKITTKAGTTTKNIDDIIHLKYPNPLSPFVGAGTLSHIAEWVDVDNAATEWNRVFFENGSSPSVFFETEAVSQDQLDLAKLGYDMRFTGASNAHRPAFLPKGVKLSGQGSNPRDMEFSEADNRFRDKILSAFGVPKSVVGISEIGTSRADAEAKNYVFLAFTVKPKVERIVAIFNEQYLPSFKGAENLYFDYEDFVPENEEMDLRRRQIALGGQSYQSINEVRAEIGLPPIMNGDSVYGSFATVPIGTPVKEPVKASGNTITQKTVKPHHIKKFEKHDNALDRVAKSLVEAIDKTMTTEQIDEIVHKQFITRVTPFESKFVGAVEKHDQLVKAQVLDNLETFEKSIKGKKSFDASFKALFDETAVADLFVGITIPVLQELMQTEGQAQADRLNTTDPFNPNNASIQDRIKTMLNMTAQSYTSTTLKLLNNTLGEGVANGEGLAKLTNRVADVFDLTSKYRAEQVARTTVFATANASAREAYRQSGVVSEVKWHTAEDEMVCEYCGPMNGKTVGIDDTFFDDGETVQGADGGTFKVGFGDIIDPPLHVNCRCFTNAVVSRKDNENTDTTEKGVDDDLEFLETLVNELQ